MPNPPVGWGASGHSMFPRIPARPRPGGFRVLCHQFRAQPMRAFFLPSGKGPANAPKSDPVHQRVVALRKQNLSIYDISAELAAAGKRLSPAAISLLLK